MSIVFVGQNTRNDLGAWMWTCQQIDGPNGEWGPWHYDKDDWGWADTFDEAQRLGTEHAQLHVDVELNEDWRWPSPKAMQAVHQTRQAIRAIYGDD